MPFRWRQLPAIAATMLLALRYMIIFAIIADYCHYAIDVIDYAIGYSADIR